MPNLFLGTTWDSSNDKFAWRDTTQFSGKRNIATECMFFRGDVDHLFFGDNFHSQRAVIFKDIAWTNHSYNLTGS